MRPDWGRLPVAQELIGRDDEVLLIRERLGAHRLLTLTGISGIGKSSVAIRAAHELRPAYADGVVYFNLRLVPRPEDLVPRIAGVFLPTHGESDLMPELLTQLEGKQVLVVLDNCEHVYSACRLLVGDLLRSCPEVRVLCTSQRALCLPEECPHTVPPLQYLPDLAVRDGSGEVVGHRVFPDSIDGTPARELLLREVARVRPGPGPAEYELESAGRICSSLHGVPAALLLAARRVALLGFAAAEQQITTAVTGLKDAGPGSEPEQGSLRAALACAYESLDASEQLLLRRMVGLTAFYGLPGFPSSPLFLAIDDCTWKGLPELCELYQALSRDQIDAAASAQSVEQSLHRLSSHCLIETRRSWSDVDSRRGEETAFRPHPLVRSFVAELITRNLPDPSTVTVSAEQALLTCVETAGSEGEGIEVDLDGAQVDDIPLTWAERKIADAYALTLWLRRGGQVIQVSSQPSDAGEDLYPFGETGRSVDRQDGAKGIVILGPG